MYNVTRYEGSKRYKNTSLILEENGIFDDERRITKYGHIRQIVVGKRVGRRHQKISVRSIFQRISGNQKGDEFAFSLIDTKSISDFSVQSEAERYHILREIMDKLPNTSRNQKKKDRIRELRYYRGSGRRLIVDHKHFGRSTAIRSDTSKDSKNCKVSETESLSNAVTHESLVRHNAQSLDDFASQLMRKSVMLAALRLQSESIPGSVHELSVQSARSNHSEANHCTNTGMSAVSKDIPIVTALVHTDQCHIKSAEGERPRDESVIESQRTLNEKPPQKQSISDSIASSPESEVSTMSISWRARAPSKRISRRTDTDVTLEMAASQLARQSEQLATLLLLAKSGSNSPYNASKQEPIESHESMSMLKPSRKTVQHPQDGEKTQFSDSSESCPENDFSSFGFAETVANSPCSFVSRISR